MEPMVGQDWSAAVLLKGRLNLRVGMMPVLPIVEPMRA
jgi:hypothetical protein